MTDKLQTNIENAPKLWKWIQERGGVAVWKSINLSNPGGSWSTPRLTDDNQPYPKPTWQAENEPSRIITSPDEIEVSLDKEVKRFHVAVRRSSNGLQLKLSDASSRRVRKEVEKAGDGAYHEFDYSMQEAVIFKPERTMTLTEWRKGVK